MFQHVLRDGNRYGRGSSCAAAMSTLADMKPGCVIARLTLMFAMFDQTDQPGRGMQSQRGNPSAILAAPAAETAPTDNPRAGLELDLY